MNLLTAAGVIFAVQMLFFILALVLKTDKFTDLAYGLTFVFVSITSLVMWGDYHPIKVIMVVMVSLWGIRLAGYLFYRILKIGRDKRFDNIREKFLPFLGFWLLQTVTIWVVLLPTMVILETEIIEFNVVSAVGIGIWLLGLLIETVADWQKFRFKSKTENKGRWIATGLWKYSRHPNYLGEILVWVGVYLFVAVYFREYQLLTILSPIYISILLLFVSGIPPLEKRYAKKYEGNKEYGFYKENTRLLLPLPK